MDNASELHETGLIKALKDDPKFASDYLFEALDSGHPEIIRLVLLQILKAYNVSLYEN